MKEHYKPLYGQKRLLFLLTIGLLGFHTFVFSQQKDASNDSTTTLETSGNNQDNNSDGFQPSDTTVMATNAEEGEIIFIRVFDTDTPTIKCYTVAGICYHPPSDIYFLRIPR